MKPPLDRKSISDILGMKKAKKPIVMLTAYDYATAQIVDESGVDIILVGDSLANVVLGYKKTSEVTMDEMIHHTKAVNRAVERALLVGDMPYVAYQQNVRDCVKNAKRFRDEAGAAAVKLEWFDRCVEVTQEIVRAGIPVMGHVGLTPQTADVFKVQGTDLQSARSIMAHARELEQAGAFSIVLECIPDLLAKKISASLNIPTIGIGSGVYCDGQVLVIHDMLGLQDFFQPKFVKRFAQLKKSSLEAIKRYNEEVRSLKFPDEAHSYHMKPEELRKLDG